MAFNSPEDVDTMFQSETVAMSASHVAYLGECLVAVVDGTLLISPETSNTLVERIGYRVRAIDVSPPHTRKRIAIAHEGGLNIFWWEMGELHCQRLDTKNPFEHVHWMPGGRLFAISGRTLYRFHTNKEHTTACSKIALQGNHPTAAALD